MRRARIAALAAALFVTACSQASSPRPEARPSSPESTSGPRQERERTRRPGPRVENEAFGASRRLVGRAVVDLKRMGLWRPLTRHLYVVKIGSRLGRDNIPRDGHLADAYITGVVEEGGSGAWCDIMFFPAAIADDLGRWRSYHVQGFVEDPAPGPRAFWAALLAHELAHCLEGRRGEQVAERWEQRALRRFEARAES